jgi:hypothetical protein
MAGDFLPLMGYTPNPRATAEFLATLPRPTLAQAGPDLVLDENKDVFLGQYLLGVAPDWKRGSQKIGSCVGWGFALSCDILAACDIALRGESETYGGRVLEASVYAFSRVEVRGSRNLGGDGSYGGAAAKAVTKYGTLHYGIDYGSGDRFDDNSGSREKEWGRDGVPDRLEPFAAKHKVSTVALVTTFEDTARSIQNGYPVALCSGMGFSMTLRDGYMTPMGSWAHCQMAAAVKWEPEPAILVVNSWGDCYSGTYDTKLPPQFQRSAGWVKAKDFTRMIGPGEDSFALSGYAGFPPRTLPNWTGGAL